VKIPEGEPVLIRRALGEIEERLAALGTLDIPQVENGLFAAVGGTGAGAASGYQHAWLRDNAMIAYSRWRRGDASSALRTLQSLEAFLTTQNSRMSAIIQRPEKKEDVQERPHVRFDASTLRELPQTWSHAQNDALGDVMWLRLLMAGRGGLPLNSSEVELFGTMARYFGAIEYWRDNDSGPWEEEKKVNSSSVGTVLAALELARRCGKDTGAFRAIDGELECWIANGRATLNRQLPFESPPGRKTDAALLLLIHPLEVIEDPHVADRIVSLVRARLQGGHGIRRYVGDSYFCQDYDEWFSPEEQTADFSNAMEIRNELLRPGCEAQWCVFDPMLSTIYGRRFRAQPDRADLFLKQVRYLNRALAQLTGGGQCPELYYLKRGEWTPNDHTPLAWTQANLAVAIEELKASLEGNW
jgi:GH15 family glucan-1,4-alpha-glucosidase